MKYHFYAGSQAQLVLVPNVLVPNLQIGNHEGEALASRDRKLELPKPNSQAGAWELANILLDSWRFLQREAGFKLYGYVILENHLHFIAASENLSHDMQRFKSYTARQIIKHLEQCHSTRLLELLAFFKRAHKRETNYQIWEEGNHPQIVESEEVMRQKLDYMHQNPVKRGYVDQPEHWRYSSARNYAGEEGLLEVIRAW